MKLEAWSSQQQVDSSSGAWEQTSSGKPEILCSIVYVDYIKRLEATAAPLDHSGHTGDLSGEQSLLQPQPQIFGLVGFVPYAHAGFFPSM